jgi:hypothetical protein
MKNWFNKNYKTLIIAAFLIPILTVAVVSISHVTEWYGLSNPVSWAVYLSIGIEIAALSALAAISANMGSKVYFPFAVVTIVQFIGNIFFAYSYIDIDSKQFKDWVDLVSPFVEFMGVEQTDYVGHKRFLAFFSGGMLPIISLSFLHMLVKFTEEDKNKEVKQEESTPEDLKKFVDESTRIRLSEEDLKIIEERLLNPLPPNEKLKQAFENYKDTDSKEVQKETLVQMMKNDQELGLYDEPTLDNNEIEKTEEILTPPIVEEVKQENETPEFEVPEQEGWTEEIKVIENDFNEFVSEKEEKTQLEKLQEFTISVEQVPTIEETVEETFDDTDIDKIYDDYMETERIESEENVFSPDYIEVEIPQPTQTISVLIDESKFKTFEPPIEIHDEEIPTTIEEPTIEEPIVEEEIDNNVNWSAEKKNL